MIWPKCLAITRPAYAMLAKNDRLVDIVSELLGEDVTLWGAVMIARTPNQVHQWHDDIESSSGDGFVSIWMGLKNTDGETSLKIVPGSHNFNQLLFQLAKDRGVTRADIEDEVVLE